MIKRIYCLLFAVLLAVLNPLTAFGAGLVDESQDVSLTIAHTYGEIKLQNVEVALYYISAMDKRGELTPQPEYAAYASMLDIRGKNDEAWSAMATMLDKLVAETETIEAVARVVTDENGIASFPTEGTTLKNGLYLVASTEHIQDGYVYKTLPILVLLPGRDSKTDEWIYDVVIQAKPEQSPVKEDYKVVKKWKDYGDVEHRPKSVTVQLICDGKPYLDPVQLSEENHWMYIWKELETNHEWTVKETAVEHYTGEVVKEGNTFIVINKPNVPNIPQTGQLNWPIPGMTVAGLALFAIGWFLCFGRKREQNEN
ncbi:MAG: Cna B-type domain-containing protein [Lachnospiraceae bacterium]|nr:Cna B-type domain-containing protein [Lachnospiraceae bacterium]